MTDGTKATANQLEDFIQGQWGARKSGFYAPEDLSFVPDPFDNSSSDSAVMRVYYQKGSYTPSGSDDDVAGGCQFYMSPFQGQAFKKGLVRYDVAFSENFDWVKGGKLPGIFGASHGTRGCTGGDMADGDNCFSVRLMWRENGEGEAYAYLPPSNHDLCLTEGVLCNDEYGTSLGRGYLQFERQTWSTIEIFVQMDDIDRQNGILRVWQDNRPVIYIEGLSFRTIKAFAVSDLLFSTFYGGGSSDYAATNDTFTYFRNMQFSVGHPETLVEPPSTASLFSASPILVFALCIISCIVSLYS
ncbi:hypothetical protein K492DRAFT_134841 [Lichtheimia hyalospora FSU 10163]|nr:hypothetical protein K492DRAFT_134841 [Lichtheimia hyalospora FSU 10163]